MTVVVDASVIVAALSDAGTRGDAARAALRGDQLVAPHLLPVEVTHAMRKHVLLGRMGETDAAARLRGFAALPVNLVAFARHASRVWDLRDAVTPYDAWYVAVAEAADVPLVTLDRRLANAPGPRCRFIVVA